MNGADIFFFRWKVQFKITIFFSRCHSKFRQRLKSWVHKSNDFIHSATLPFWYPNNILPEQKYKTDRFLVHVIFSKPTNSQREEEGGLEDEFRLRKSWTKRPMAGARTRGREDERTNTSTCTTASEWTSGLCFSFARKTRAFWSCELSKVNHLRQRKEKEKKKERKRERERENERVTESKVRPTFSWIGHACIKCTAKTPF